jgi:hypothetical protein
MRRSHKRTQSAYTPGSKEQIYSSDRGAVNEHDIMKLLQVGENITTSKIVSYERLETNSLQENSYLKFGNCTIDKINAKVNLNNKVMVTGKQFDLGCIPENSKSSEFSSQQI